MRIDVKKGDVYWVEVNNGSDRNMIRPMLVISNDAFNNTSHTPIGFLLTRSEKKMDNDYNYKLMMEDGKPSSVNVSQVYTVHKSNFKNKEQIVSLDHIENIMALFEDIILNGY